MQLQDFTMTFFVDQSPETVFNAIRNVRGWWSEGLQGNSANAGDEFIYRHKDLHYSKQRLVEVIPDRKIVWLVTDSKIGSFTRNNEWTNTTISFQISKEGEKTKLLFTHHGLVPEVECFDACSGGWRHYLQGSLLPLITIGKGNPDDKAIASMVKG